MRARDATVTITGTTMEEALAETVESGMGGEAGCAHGLVPTLRTFRFFIHRVPRSSCHTHMQVDRYQQQDILKSLR